MSARFVAVQAVFCQRPGYTKKTRESADIRGLAPGADAAGLTAQPSALLKPREVLPVLCARRPVDTRITAANAKPTPFRNDICRHGRGQFGHVVLATPRGV